MAIIKRLEWRRGLKWAENEGQDEETFCRENRRVDIAHVMEGHDVRRRLGDLLTEAGFPSQISAKLKWHVQKIKLWNDCSSTEWCYATKMCFLLSCSKKHGSVSLVLAWFILLQQLHSLTLSLIEDNVGVLWELCWKGMTLTHGSGHVRGTSGRW